MTNSTVTQFATLCMHATALRKKYKTLELVRNLEWNTLRKAWDNSKKIILREERKKKKLMVSEILNLIKVGEQINPKNFTEYIMLNKNIRNKC